MFKTNESKLDKNIRLVVGVAALLLGIFVLSGGWQIVAILIGILGIITGLTGFCGVYKILGIKTNKK